jgi:gliding motility-associated-like protein
MTKLIYKLLFFLALLVSCNLNAQISFKFTPQNPTLTVGSTVLLGVEVENFDSIAIMEYAFQWDTSKLTYDTVFTTGPGITPIRGLSNGSFNAVGNKLYMTWDEGDPRQVPVSVACKSIIYQIRFKVKDANQVSISNAVGVNLVPYVENRSGKSLNIGFKLLDLTGSLLPALKIKAATKNVPLNASFSVDVTAEDFTKIVSQKYGIKYNKDVIKFDSVGALNLNSLKKTSFDTTKASTLGEIVHTWSHKDRLAITVPNNTVIYKLYFKAIGAAGATSPIQFVDLGCNGINIERLDTVKNIVRNTQLLNTNGLITIDGGTTGTTGCDPLPNFNGYGLYGAKVSGKPGDTVTVRISVINPKPTASITVKFGFDNALLEYLSASNFNPNLLGFTASNITNGPANRINLAWFNNNANDDQMVNGDALVDFSFKIKGLLGSSSLITFPLIEIASANNNIYSIQADSGKVTITNTPAPLCLSALLTHAKCFGGSTGAITTTLTGTSSNNTVYAWKGPSNFTSSAASLNGIVAGTYTVSVSNNGAVKLDTFIIKQPTDITVNGTVTNILCQGLNTGKIDLAVSGGTGSSYTYAWTGNGVAPNVKDQLNLAAGNYTVIVKDSLLCSKTVNFTVQSNNAPLAVTAAIKKICVGATTGSITLNVLGGTSPYTYNWTGTGTGLLPTIKDQTVGAGNFNVTVTDNVGCTKSLSSIVVDQATAMVITETIVQPTTGNNNGTISIVLTGDAPFTYKWVGSRVAPTIQNQTGLGAGNFTVTVTDKNGCTQTKSFVLAAANPAPCVNGQVITPTCTNQSTGSISLTIGCGSGSYSVQWFNRVNPNTVINTSNPLTGAAQGAYFCVITDNNSGLKTTTSDYSVGNAGNAINIQITIKNDSCATSKGSIDANVTGGGNNGFTYKWSNNATTASIANLVQGIYGLTVTDVQSGCQASPTPSALVVGTDCNPIQISSVANVRCNGGTDGFINIKMVNGTAPFNITWNGGSTIITSLNGVYTINNLPAGLVTITVTDGAGKSYTSTQNIIAPGVISITGQVTADNGTCNGAITTTVAGGTGILVYAWTPTNRTTKDLTGLTSGTYTLNVTDANGCIKSNSFVVMGDVPPMIVNSNITQPKCSNDSGKIVIVASGGGATNYNYTWKDNNGNVLSNNKDLTAKPGRYCLTISYTRCSTNFDSTLCYNLVSTSNLKIDSVSVNGTSATAYASGGSGVYSYIWCNNAITQTVNNLASGNCAVTVTDATGCSAVKTFVVNTSGADPCTISPNSLFNGVNIRCFGEINGSATVTSVLGAVGQLVYSWDNGETKARANSLSAGINRVTIYDSNGKQFNCTITLKGPDKMVTIINPICSNAVNGDGSATASTIGGVGTYTYKWTDKQQTKAPIVSGLLPGKYSVFVLDANNCSTFNETEILNCSGGTPNNCLQGIVAFTPNNDGTNDYFTIKTDNCNYATVPIEIYNRWGQLVYESKNYDNTWDGRTNNGNILPEGGYFYVVSGISANGQIQTNKGSVTLIRE